MNSTITVVAYINANAGHEKDVEQALKTAVQQVQSEPGCEQYVLHKNLDDAGQFVMIERWHSSEMLDQHNQAEPLQQLLRALEGKATLSVHKMTPL
ncbi:putative quinol monooxygenase [[Erwinia] mediterraneensis]|uniref:putative quinol monooxygenase n=1 Tax=[Erwinia] mediterraneensis TaxID=2161819 RepID=UPI001030B581|nr:antibiotic biosynthesis monooxygenase family protein [[Erwinia] mediterraneensis]